MAAEDISSICLTFKYRLLPNKRQYDVLQHILDQQRDLYNCALQERRDAYRKVGKNITFYDQQKSLTEIRRDCAGWSLYPSRIQRGTLKRLDEAFQAFFARVKRGEKPGFPRFKCNGQFTSFAFAERNGLRFDGKRIRFKGMPGGLRVHMHRQLPEGKILSAKFIRDVKSWQVCFVIRVPCAEKRESVRRVGIDLGLTYLATLSTGENIPNPRIAQKAQKELRRRQRALARCKKGSNRRRKVMARVTRLHNTVKDTRRTALHQISAHLVREYDYIAIENLRIQNMVKNLSLSSATLDAGWGMLAEFLTYKAARAGGLVEKVGAHNTSQLCSGCGVLVPKKLKVRVHECPHCGLLLDRDHNAALNILARGVVAPGFANAA